MATKIINAWQIVSRAELKKINGGDGGFARCRTGFCLLAIIGQPDVQPGRCETNSSNQCVCQALNFPISVISDNCKT